jgi:hypothetical protein
MQGGDVRGKDIFHHIKSIGYELETTRLAKFTLLPKDNDRPERLLHTDLATNDLAMLKGLPADDILRKELMVLPTEEEDGFSFLVTNDMAVTKFTEHLKSICEEPLEAAVAVEMAYNEDDEDEDEDEDEDDKEEAANALIEQNKNLLYTFNANDGQIYPINFLYKDPRHCGLFSDVEWVGTFLKPKKSEHIILDTFTKLLGILFGHLDALEPIPGTLNLHFSKDDHDTVLHPKTRMLFRSPGTSLHYLQTNYREGDAKDNNDLLLKPQMTFSCPAMFLIPVFEEMIRPASESTHASKILNHLTTFVQAMGTAVKELCSTDAWPESKKMEGDTLATFQGYLWLFLFKVFRYCVYAGKGEDQAAYFKNTLFFNSRHGNAQLYTALKRLLAKHLGKGEDDSETIETLQKIILQPPILNKIMETIPNAKKRNNMFIFGYNLDPNNKNYGDPSYSLESYLQFFETSKKPTIDPSTDWLHHSMIDVFSSQMEIVDHLILVEVRCFLELIVDAFSDVLFPEGNKDKVGSLTIGELKQCVANYKSKPASVVKSASVKKPASASVKKSASVRKSASLKKSASLRKSASVPKTASTRKSVPRSKSASIKGGKTQKIRKI